MTQDHPWGRTGNRAHLRELAAGFGYSDGELGHLEQAVTHTSFAHESLEKIANNERLEFLGDAVVDLVVAEELMSGYPDAPEGQLSRVRASLVCTSSLARLANMLRLGEVLKLGRGEELSGGRTKESLLADAYEAVIGAVYLDLGIETARLLVRSHLGDKLVIGGQGLVERDNKTALQEWIQRTQHQKPSYEILEESGPDHAKEFTAIVLVGGDVIGRGVGRSKKQAEQSAAGHALASLRVDLGADG